MAGSQKFMSKIECRGVDELESVDFVVYQALRRRITGTVYTVPRIGQSDNQPLFGNTCENCQWYNYCFVAVRYILFSL